MIIIGLVWVCFYRGWFAGKTCSREHSRKPFRCQRGTCNVTHQVSWQQTYERRAQSSVCLYYHHQNLIEMHGFHQKNKKTVGSLLEILFIRVHNIKLYFYIMANIPHSDRHIYKPTTKQTFEVDTIFMLEIIAILIYSKIKCIPVMSS